MNQIRKSPVKSLGYNFIPKEYIPKGKDEYHLRFIQSRNEIHYRKLNTTEIKILTRNGNSSDDWNKVQVSEKFNPEQVKNCRFYGLVRIGKMEPLYLEFKNLRMQVGLFNSTIVSCDIGNNVAIENVNFMSHYITGDEVMLANINELATTDLSKFGNGIIKQGEKESVRTWLEICNENAGRKILPFNGMQPGDAFLWSKYRADEKLMKKFKDFTDKKYDNQRGYYGKIGDRTVIKNCGIIKDVWIGSDAYIKGANKLKNLTINSSPESKSQIGEGCELVNGIIGFGCRVFYGVKAVRFVLASNSHLKYGARLINSYLGENSTISCCEVLNSLIFPGHEQHHNNSFLCASLVLGQSNMAAGATIGSNHNSRSADGEIQAGRGFWPGLCISLKHSSKFASYTLIAKGDFPAELNIPIPFSLISNDVTNDRLVVMPAYWFLYNMYALARNVHKYADRDKRRDKTQEIEYDFLAPDTINEIFDAILLLQKFTAKAYAASTKKTIDEKKLVDTGAKLLDNSKPGLPDLEIFAEGFENSGRKVLLVKPQQAYAIFKQLISYYGVLHLLQFIKQHNIRSWEEMYPQLPMRIKRLPWINVGGQLIPKASVNSLIKNIHNGKIKTWDEVHGFYHENSLQYQEQKFKHAFASLLENLKIQPDEFNKKLFKVLLQQALECREWMVNGIYQSRAKDHKNEFRKMMYDSKAEMDKVTGKLSENSFINHHKAELKLFRTEVSRVISTFKL